MPMLVDEEPLEDDWTDDDDPEDDDLLICPACKGEVHEDTQKCPHCGDWITPVYPVGGGKRWLWVAAVVLVVISFLLVTIF